MANHNDKIVPDKEGAGPNAGGSSQESEVSSGEGNAFSFSDHHRELRQQVDPDTQERLVLLTKKQLDQLLKKRIKDF